MSYETASLNLGMPVDWVYPWWPSLRAFIPASTMCSGVWKSGWPIPRLIMLLPSEANLLAFAKTVKAVSVPRLLFLLAIS